MLYQQCRTLLGIGPERANRMMRLTRKSKRHAENVEREKMVRLEKAEREVFLLKIRAFRAIAMLDERRLRNHWRESIEQMIQGAAH